MLTVLTSQVSMADSALKEQKFFLIFGGTSISCYMTAGLSFAFSSEEDMRELQVINDMANITGLQWQSQLCGKAFRLIVDFQQVSRSRFDIEIKAIGHQTEDMFLVVNSKRSLMTKQEAMDFISNN